MATQNAGGCPYRRLTFIGQDGSQSCPFHRTKELPPFANPDGRALIQPRGAFLTAPTGLDSELGCNPLDNCPKPDSLSPAPLRQRQG